MSSRLVSVSSAIYPRTIVLLLKYNRSEKAELCSNEWKKARVTEDVAISQQIKNFKLNSAIINYSQSKHSSSFNQLLAKDFIGTSGYMYTWENCPKTWRGICTGKEKMPIWIPEAVSSQDLCIWHAFFGLSGSLNDINVLDTKEAR